MTVPIDEHNAEAQAVWAAFHAGNPIRPPVYLGTNTQYFIFNDDLNPGEQVTFEAYATDARRCWSFNCGGPSGGLPHQLRGNDLFLDFYDDPDYVHQLLDFIVEGTIARIRALRSAGREQRRSPHAGGKPDRYVRGGPSQGKLSGCDVISTPEGGRNPYNGTFTR